MLKCIQQAIREPDTRHTIESCCALAGRHARLSELLKLLLPRARDHGDARAAADAVACVAHAVQGAGGRGGARRDELRHALPALLDLLAEPDVGQSDDGRMRAACAEAAQQLLAACPRDALAAAAPRVAAVALLVYASDRQPPSIAPAGKAGNAAAAGWEEAEEQAAAAERLLMQLAASVLGAPAGVDDLMAKQRGAVLQILTALPLCPSSPRHVAALCRALLPSDNASLLRCADGLQRQLTAPLFEDDCQQHSCTCKTDGTPQPAHLLQLLKLTEASVGRGSGSGGDSDRPQQLLLSTLDAVLTSHPFSRNNSETAADEQLLFLTIPVLLHGGCDSAALVGARALHRLLLRGGGGGCGDEAGAGPSLLLRGWRRCCGALCLCLGGGAGRCPALRLQVCRTAHAAVDRLGADAVDWSPQQHCSEQVQQQGEREDPMIQNSSSGVGTHTVWEDPVHQLLAALDDPLDAVRCGAAGALAALLRRLARPAAGAGDGSAAAREGLVAAAVRERMQWQLESGGAAGCGELRALLEGALRS
jgi:hypothetical protein